MYVLGISVSPDRDESALPILRKAFTEMYNDTATEGYLVIDHWKDGQLNIKSLFVLIPTFIIIVISFSLATFLAWGTFRGIAKSESISKAYKAVQYKILIATFVPLVFVYTPYFCLLYFPFLGIPDLGVSATFPVLVSFFPAWDAFVIIALIKDYREGLLQLLGFKREKKSVPSSTVSEMTTRWAERRE
ncbi:hypothetical protein PRIPAC_82586 [Pristionchus pacificus]|uniref:G protein-coupled receptor n=1 Tax=Pristionchus pacificus TaxID=54126 RepID=A0A2A6C476_PRIPA|nr:hypothetical protein PRIPAC_82586 [Pristionchus pacificus]|eukprot:PDM72898.1 G protein-coupled receptor [Pristionchus pacificus]